MAKRARLDHIRDVVNRAGGDQESEDEGNSDDESDMSLHYEDQASEDGFDSDTENESQAGSVVCGAAGENETDRDTDSEGEGEDSDGDRPSEGTDNERASDNGDENGTDDEGDMIRNGGFNVIVNSDDDNEESNESNESDDANDNVLFEDDNEREQYIRHALRNWALEGGIMSMRKLDKLLLALHPLFPGLCLSYKTLLDTPIHINVVDVESGQLWYKGIRTNLNALGLRAYLNAFGCIQLDVNMDGLPLFKKSKWKFWPILAKLVGSKNQPFVISIFFGKKDPGPDELLAEFAAEVRDLEETGFCFEGENFPFKIRNYICDAPARAKVKCIIEHGGYSACEKCVVEGVWIAHRMTYNDLDQPLRTDESFIDREDPYHHTGDSPLEETNWQPVSQFRLDSLHLIYLGVYKRLLLAWRKWNGPWKLPVRVLTDISKDIEALRPSCPSDFNRPPRTLLELPYWAGTEYRRSLLYDGVLVFRDYLDDAVYEHFLLLHSAMYILSSPVLYFVKNELADRILRLFITHSSVIYGEKFVVYNVHCMCHLSAECAVHGCADEFSSFSFENKLGAIKHSLKSGYKALIQCANRDLERPVTEVILEGNNYQVTLARRHHVEDEIVDGQHFRYMRVNNIELKCNRKDACFKTVNGDVVVLRNIVKRGNEVFLVGYSFHTFRDLYDYPFPSSDIGICSVSDLSDERQAFPLHEIDSKCWLMPDGDSFACFPLLHSASLLH